MRLVAFWPTIVLILALGAYRIGWDTEAIVLGIAALLLFVGIGILEFWNRRVEELQKRAWLFDSRAKFAMQIGSLDYEGRQFLAEQMPELGVDWGVKPIVYILKDGLNTGINLEFFRKFMMDSDDKEFADVRAYNDDKTLQEKFGVSRDYVRDQWHKAVGFWSKEGYLLPNSAVGPHSYKWKSKGHYRKLAHQYVSYHVLIDLNENGAQAA